MGTRTASSQSKAARRAAHLVENPRHSFSSPFHKLQRQFLGLSMAWELIQFHPSFWRPALCQAPRGALQTEESDHRSVWPPSQWRRPLSTGYPASACTPPRTVSSPQLTNWAMSISLSSKSSIPAHLTPHNLFSTIPSPALCSVQGESPLVTKPAPSPDIQKALS